ncbi:putative aspartyl aminopeptidase [Rosa chinensis]|uniref:Putative aspartyl aminopeptidase n=1 Tax=Rosa chinensis TaxID=74649 RepID=A0A2P6QZ17_ROSCH|nr:putative aspartyl aminopeptidase [Rosa chinensis]
MVEKAEVCIFVAGNGFHIVGAHTDSPCLKLKPVSKVAKGGYLEVGVQTYGGGLWHTWFDRDLIIAGRVMVREEKDGVVSYSHRLVRIEKPIMRIPTLAIHLDRDVREAFKVNAQSHLLPVLATTVKRGGLC